jgi:hypothetical protein
MPCIKLRRFECGLGTRRTPGHEPMSRTSTTRIYSTANLPTPTVAVASYSPRWPINPTGTPCTQSSRWWTERSIRLTSIWMANGTTTATTRRTSRRRSPISMQTRPHRSRRSLGQATRQASAKFRCWRHRVLVTPRHNWRGFVSRHQSGQPGIRNEMLS